ncbi:LOW QUALITY PROTEIN: zinc finger CCCH domain-containing protein 23-like [Phalaenopsis equestris]|uniref:LOW QUALITY PROTEIN: zinc finger CCCH domain-containing protein 23-like n=1 Tax=Phalaenopsis equestris TaxID=78828 RepID=UPI0009E5A110|nr:LOW QUALITY PROTEIN: zinc finger CCCH domain-containing protein 23-like [Phalaenopsis equestris]
MDAYEATKIVFSRIQNLDPENAAKIMGLLLIQDHGEKEMIRLAFGPESLLQSLVFKAQRDLGLLARSQPLAIPSPSSWSPPSAGDELIDQLQLQAGEDIGWAHRCFAGDPWKPCLYFARGYCKNGARPAVAAATAALERSKSMRFMSSASIGFPYSPTGPLPPSPKCMNMNFLLQQQRSDSQRGVAAPAALMLGGEDLHKFIGRPKVERNDFSCLASPVSRQIYLTFPADSTFREEDVSNYFSIYGPVQDVRIPYQQKRMFGFVTFLYPETVKLILAKGNPHFVCDARVLVKPYKEKGKVPDKNRKQPGDRGDFSGCTTPTGLDSRDPFDFQQLGSRMLYSSNNQDILLRRKLEEQRELQQAIELQQRRFMGLQLLDLKRIDMNSSSFPIKTTLEEDKSSVLGVVDALADMEETSPKKDGDFQERAEHNLPDSPFASPTKLAAAGDGGDYSSLVSEADAGGSTASSSSSSSLFTSTLLPANSALETMASFKSCFFQMPRFSSGPGAVGL